MSQFDIGSKLKELVSHSLVYGLGSVLQALLGFILIPIYTKNLTVDMYGTWSLITLAGTLAGVVFYLGISSALARSYHDYTDSTEQKKVVSTSLLLTACGAFTQIGIGILFRKNLSEALFGSDQYSIHIALAMTSAAFNFINGLFYVVLRFQRRSKMVVAINLISMLNGGGLIIYFLLVKEMGVLAPLLGDAINQLITCMILGYCSRDLLGWRFSRREMRLQLHYGLPTVVSGIAYYLLTSGDRYFIKHFCSLADVGAYSLGSRIGALIQILLIMPFAQIWTPVRMELRGKPDTQRFFEQTLTYYVICGALFAAGLSLFCRELLMIVAHNPGYALACRAVPFVVSAYFLYGLMGFFDTGIIYARRSLYTALLFLGTLGVNWGLNLFLLPRIGFIGAGVSQVVSMVVLVSAVYFVSNRLLPVPIEIGRVSICLVIFLTTLLVGYFLNVPGFLWPVFLKTSLFLASLSAFYYFVLNENEKVRLKGMCMQIWLLITKRRIQSEV